MTDILRTLVCLAFLMSFYQNCSGVNFAKLSDTAAERVGDGDEGDATDDPNDPGLDGGHFDLDTSSQVYGFSAGRTDHHVHEYDDKHNVNYVDFFNLLDSGFTKISDKVGSTQKFIIIVANAQLSPGAILEINGTKYPVVDYQKLVENFRTGTAPLTEFTLAGSNPLASLKMKFKADALSSGGLIPTQTGCVVKNDSGATGEYRNGALVIQILDSSTATIDPSTKVASRGLLWEATVFWHKEGAGCY